MKPTGRLSLPLKRKPLQSVTSLLRKVVDSQSSRLEKSGIDQVFSIINSTELAETAFASLIHIMDHFSNNATVVFKCLKLVYILLELDHLRFFEIALNFVPEIESVRLLNFKNAKVDSRGEIHCLARSLYLHLVRDGPLPAPASLGLERIVTNPIVPKVKKPCQLVAAEVDMIEWSDGVEVEVPSAESEDLLCLAAHEDGNSLFDPLDDGYFERNAVPIRSPSQDLFAKIDAGSIFRDLPVVAPNQLVAIEEEPEVVKPQSAEVQIYDPFENEPDVMRVQSAKPVRPYKSRFDFDMLDRPSVSREVMDPFVTKPSSFEAVVLDEVEGLPARMESAKSTDMFEPIPASEEEEGNGLGLIEEFEPIDEELGPTEERSDLFEPIAEGEPAGESVNEGFELISVNESEEKPQEFELISTDQGSEEQTGFEPITTSQGSEEQAGFEPITTSQSSEDKANGEFEPISTSQGSEEKADFEPITTSQSSEDKASGGFEPISTSQGSEEKAGFEPISEYESVTAALNQFAAIDDDDLPPHEPKQRRVTSDLFEPITPDEVFEERDIVHKNASELFEPIVEEEEMFEPIAPSKAPPDPFAAYPDGMELMTGAQVDGGLLAEPPEPTNGLPSIPEEPGIRSGEFTQSAGNILQMSSGRFSIMRQSLSSSADEDPITHVDSSSP